ncbi:transcription elongation factor S-II [Phascolomyces articulosus]|uniref:Transcription elongation factor S-II n=1 Tax=Phascolomyces articulosus TaxID=60185 RepID=A0AAD5JUI3_9FUNG|nr:transcription elongation factor S-II [Phascolomyces articulosus]
MEPIRQKSQDLLHKALAENNKNSTSKVEEDDLQPLAESIETAIYELHDAQVNNSYKESIRSHILNLKDQQNPLSQRVLNGEVDPMEFASMDSAEMATADRRKSNEQLRRNSLQASMGYTTDNRPRHRDLEQGNDFR